MRSPLVFQWFPVLALLTLFPFAMHANDAADGSCCSKPTNSAAMSCCSNGEDAGLAATAPSERHAAHQAASDASDSHAGHGATGSGMSCCSMSERAGKGAEMGRMGHGGAMGGKRAVMPDAMRLLHNHASLERTVEDIPNGVRTVSTTNDPRVLELLRKHPRDMYAFYEAGGVVRPHDPIFRELSRVADEVTMEFKDVENGIEVVATSDDPEVVKLIRAHAKKVSEFVQRGMPALHEGAPLPQDYHPAN